MGRGGPREEWSRGGGITHSKHGLLTRFKGYCKQVFVVRMIFICGNGDREGGKGEGWSLGGGLT